MQLVPIPEDAWVAILRDAWRRSEPKRILGWRTRTYGGGDSLPIHIWGLAGEYVVGRLLGLEYDKGVHPTDGASDFTLPGGASVEVKTRTKWGWDYVPSRNHKGLGDWLSLVWPRSKSDTNGFTNLSGHLSIWPYEVDNAGNLLESGVRGELIQLNPKALCVVGFASRETFDKHAVEIPQLKNQRGLGAEWFKDPALLPEMMK